jgi:hypothetical protein
MLLNGATSKIALLIRSEAFFLGSSLFASETDSTPVHRAHQ